MAKDPDFLLATPTDIGEGDSKNTVWTNCGVAWNTKKGDGINIVLNALPVNGKLLLRKFIPKEQRQKKEAKAALL